ncbi:hypothetical protein VNO78_16300 [Psophocarpus tetragonolobus]|uniref:TPX2 C-terminal domain-containing protein n=1 Tax=Psophocarpus tetragonolobus TaxID=3891 RepID=A0AAN9SFJ6_PSOTE
MGDSSACLMQQPFCYASGFPKEANTSNPNHALGQSVSFGRFMSESLAWDKWSTFSHNRYVEEAERFTRPGSVAQKKAFFEAHYMKLAAQKAAAMLEQANNASQTQKEQEAVVGNTHNSHMTSPKSKLVLNDENAQVFNIESDATAYNSHSNRDTTFPQSNKLEGAQPKIDHQASVVKLQNQLEKGNNYKEPSEEGTKLDQDNLQSKGKNKQRVSSFKLLKIIGNLLKSTPVKSITPSLSSKDDIATPMSNKPALNSADKERSTSKPPQISFNFTLIREINRLTVSLGRKFGSTEVGASSSKASKHSSTLPRTTTKTKASKNELKNHSSFSSLTEAERNKRTSLLISTPLSLSSEAIASSRKKSSRPLAAASPAGTGEPLGGPDPAAPHDRRSRLERTPRSRRRSRLARPNRGGDRVSVDRPDRVAAEIVSTAASAALRRVSTAQIPSDLGASALINRAARSSGSSSRFRRLFQRFSTVFFVPDPDGSWRFGASRAACSTAVPRGLPLAKIPSALVRRRSNREGKNIVGAGSAQEPFPFS